MEKQPAYIGYVFKDAYTELGNTIKTTFAMCGETIVDSWDSLCDNFSDIFDVEFFEIFACSFKIGYYFFKLLFSLILTPVICAVVSAIQCVITMIMMMIAYVVFALAWLADQGYLTIKGIASNCSVCQHKFRLPVYVCPNCGKKHTRLVPSIYGIFNRRCECGYRLPATFFNGRQKLQALCPNCLKKGVETVIGDGGYHFDMCIPIIGGPSAGKTCYINMAISEIEKNAADKYGLVFESADLSEYQLNQASLQRGRRPEKTADMKLKYYQFYLTPKKMKLKNMVSLCDIGGEVFSDSQIAGQQIGYRYANAFLMIIDPLSIPAFRKTIANTVNIGSYNASEIEIDQVLNMIVSTLMSMYNLKSKDMLKTNIALVFTKSDIPGIDKEIGESALTDYMAAHPKMKDKYKATNIICEDFLEKYDEHNFLHDLKSKFKSVQFFVSSALGHNEDGTAFTPKNVEEPALWLIDKTSKYIDLKHIWGRTI